MDSFTALVLPPLLAALLYIVILKYVPGPFNYPVDFNRNVFGPNKTFRGFVYMPLFTMLFGWILVPGEASLILPGYFMVGLFYVLLELPNSFVKRRLGISAGLGTTPLQKITDLSDSLVGCALAYIVFLNAALYPVFIAFIAGVILRSVLAILLSRYGFRKPLLKIDR